MERIRANSWQKSWTHQKNREQRLKEKGPFIPWGREAEVEIWIKQEQDRDWRGIPFPQCNRKTEGGENEEWNWKLEVMSNSLDFVGLTGRLTREGMRISVECLNVDLKIWAIFILWGCGIFCQVWEDGSCKNQLQPKAYLEQGQRSNCNSCIKKNMKFYLILRFQEGRNCA